MSALAIPMHPNLNMSMSPSSNLSFPAAMPSATSSPAAAVWPSHLPATHTSARLARPNLKRHASNDLPSGAVDADIARARLTKRRATEDVVTANLERMSIDPRASAPAPSTLAPVMTRKRSADQADLPEYTMGLDVLMDDDQNNLDAADEMDLDMDAPSSSPRPLSPPIKARRTSQSTSPRASALAATRRADANKAQNLQLTLFRPPRRASGFIIDDTLVESLRDRLGDQLPAHVLASPAALAYLARTLAQGLPVPGRFLMPLPLPMASVDEEEEEEEEGDEEEEIKNKATRGMLRGKIEELPDDWQDEGEVKIQVAKGVPVLMEDEQDQDEDMDQDEASGMAQAESPLLEEVLGDVEAMDLDD
ncbi:hypothetical protein BCR44DRAFT_43720 [Catenaria anguillulae PL171]|uniref:Uncharacterized protein n=1 Tax=Catenaria anguillulae PL171 TaxID=765915 RepID=A0A1Y2HQS4_9FUNG|nr:hypothetical protein BCR44DRAFT_43720 [Catenaria anguillulae PL171]